MTHTHRLLLLIALLAACGPSGGDGDGTADDAGTGSSSDTTDGTATGPGTTGPGTTSSDASGPVDPTLADSTITRRCGWESEALRLSGWRRPPHSTGAAPQLDAPIRPWHFPPPQRPGARISADPSQDGDPA